MLQVEATKSISYETVSLLFRQRNLLREMFRFAWPLSRAVSLYRKESLEYWTITQCSFSISAPIVYPGLIWSASSCFQTIIFVIVTLV
jgi:hypothetical protein